MPSTSKKQQRFFGLVKAIQEGKATGSGKAEEAAQSMSKKDVSDFASTEHKGLPEKQAQEPRTRAENLARLALMSGGVGIASAGGYGLTKLIYDNLIRPTTIDKLEKQMTSIKRKPKSNDLMLDSDEPAMLPDDSSAESSLTKEELGAEDTEDKSKVASDEEAASVPLTPEEKIEAGNNPFNNPFVYGATIPLALAVPAISTFWLSRKLIDKARASKLDSDVAQAKEEFEEVLKKTGSDLQRRVDRLYKQAATEEQLRAQYDALKNPDDKSYADKSKAEGINLDPSLVPFASDEAANSFAGKATNWFSNTEIGSKLLTYLGLPLGVGAVAGYLYINDKMKKNPELRKRRELQALLKRDLAAQAGEQGLSIKDDPQGNKYVDL